MKTFNTIFEEVSQKQLNDLETFADRLLNKFDVDIEFTKHFADRMNDARNKPAITITELEKLFKKMADNQGKKIKKYGNKEAILKDMQSDLNLPIVVNWKNGEFEVVHKTIMRKKNFKSPDPEVKYESVTKKTEKMKDDPCWKDHEMVGTKTKNGKTVPNCVPKEAKGTDMPSESTAEYGKSQAAIARKRQQAAMKPGEMDKLKRLKDMLRNSNDKVGVVKKESVDEKTAKDWSAEHARATERAYKKANKKKDKAYQKSKRTEEVDEGYVGSKGEKGRDYHNAGEFDKETAYSHAKKHDGVVHKDASGKYLVKHGKGKHVSEGYSPDLDEEKSVSVVQQKMMGMALAYKRGEMPDASDEVKKIAKSMTTKELEDFAKTKHKGLPMKKEETEQKTFFSLREARRQDAAKDLYFDTYTAAVQHARAQAEKQGYEVEEDDWFRQVNTGKGKPGKDKTTRHTLNLTMKGKPVRKSLAIQVYNRGSDQKPYELNYYVS